MDKMRISVVRDSRNKDSPWAVRWYEPSDIETGKRKRRCKSFPTRQGAQTFAAELRLERPAARVSGGVTLGQFCQDWLKTVKPNIRPATYVSYASTVGRLLAHFGAKCKLGEITTMGAENFLSHLVKMTKKQTSEPLSPAAREQHKRNCKLIFNKAVLWGKLRDNPFGKLKRVKIDPRRWHRLSPAEFLALVDAATDLQTKCLYALLYTAGLRLCEALSLRWCDIDFERGTVTIDSREGNDNWPPFAVKDREKRSIPLPPYTVNLLTTWLAEAPKGKPPADYPYVLLSKERQRIVRAKWHRVRKARKPWLNRYWANNTLRNFNKHVQRAGIAPIGALSIHTLRKNAGQTWADRLPINAAKDLMGHSDVATTQKFYLQTDEIHRREAAKAMQDWLDRAEKRTYSGTYEPSAKR
jgi:integrase